MRLVMNGKTKYMNILAAQSDRVPRDILIGVHIFEGVKNFSYPGLEMNFEIGMKSRI